MQSIISEVEDMLVRFVRERVSHQEWQDIKTEKHITAMLSYDDECEMKDYVWREVMYMVRWGSVLREVKEMARSVLSDEEESD
jgi:hypothetical protein